MNPRVTLSLVIVVLLSVFGAAAARAQGLVIPVVEPGVSQFWPPECYGGGAQEFPTVSGAIATHSLYPVQQMIEPPWPCACCDWCPPRVSATGCYVVRRGDTLARIAAWYGTSVHYLATANRIPNPNLIYPGQCLRIISPECEMRCPSCSIAQSIAYDYVRSPVPTPDPSASSYSSSAGSNPSSYWYAEFYANGDLSGPPLLGRMDRDIRFAWGYASPAPGVPADNFSARWTRTMGLPAGRYLLRACSDDGLRVYVDSLLVIDAWQVQSGKCQSKTLDLQSSNTRTLIVTYFEADGAAQIEVSIQPL
jgi:hypothetical protein